MKMEFRSAVLFAVVACSGASSLLFTHSAHAQRVRTSSRTVTLAPVGFETRELKDENRRNWQNTGPRPLSTVIWYPAAAGSPMGVPAIGDAVSRAYFVQRSMAVGAEISATSPQHPLILLSHGSTSVNLSLGWLGAYLASRGYIAAAVNHHGNTSAEGQPLAQGFLMWERAADLSAVLDRLLADPKFGPRIDRNRIAAAGHSAGGATVIMLAGGQFTGEEMGRFCASPDADSSCEPRAMVEKSLKEIERLRASDPVVQASALREARSYRDDRVRSVFAMAPAVGRAFTVATLRTVTIPVFIATAKVDTVTPMASNARWYANYIPDAQLFTVPGNANHMTFGSECTPEGVRESFVCRDGEGVNRARVHEDLARRAVDFFERSW